MGRTCLLSALTEKAGASGVRVLRAQGNAAERAFPFGVTQQLFEPLLDGTAADEAFALPRGPAAPARLLAGALLTEHTDNTTARAVSHALYRLTAGLAAHTGAHRRRRPTVDRPRVAAPARLSGGARSWALPVTLALTLNSGAPREEAAELVALTRRAHLCGLPLVASWTHALCASAESALGMHRTGAASASACLDMNANHHGTARRTGTELAAAVLVTCLTELVRHDDAREVVDRYHLDGPLPELWTSNQVLYSRGMFRLATGDPSRALADFLECGRRLRRWGVVNPAVMAWRSRAGRAGHDRRRRRGGTSGRRGGSPRPCTAHIGDAWRSVGGQGRPACFAGRPERHRRSHHPAA